MDASNSPGYKEDGHSHQAANSPDDQTVILKEQIRPGSCMIEVVYNELGQIIDYKIAELKHVFAGQLLIEEATGNSGDQFFFHESRPWLTSCDQVARTGEPLRLECFDEKANNWYSVSLASIGGKGSRLLAAIFEDITLLKTREWQQQFLLTLTDALAPLTNSAAIQGEAVRLVREHLKAGWCCYCEFNSTGNIATVLKDSVREGLPRLTGVHDFSNCPEFIERLRNEEAFTAADIMRPTLLSQRLSAHFTLLGIHSLMCVPLVRNGHLLAALIVGDTGRRQWRNETGLANEVVRRTGIALERVKVQQAQRLSQERTEEALRASEEKYRSLFESIDEGFSLIELIFDDHGKVVDYWHREHNPAFTRMTGIQNGAGRKMSEWIPYLEPEWHRIMETVYYSGEPQRIEYPVQQLGQWYSCYLSVTDGGGSRFIVCVYDNITERKRREESLAFLNEVNQDLARLNDIDQTMDHVGERIREYFGVGHCTFVQIVDDRQAARIIRHWHQPGQVGISELSEFGSKALEQSAREGNAFSVQDTASDARIDRERYTSRGISSFLHVPFRREGSWLFSLLIYDTAPRSWAKDEIDLLCELTTDICARLDRAQAEQSARKSESQQVFQLELSDAINQLDSPAEIIAFVTARVCEYLDVDRVYYGEIQGDLLTVEQEYTRGVVSIVGKHSLKPYGQEFITTCKPGTVIAVDDIDVDTRLTQGARAILRGKQIAAFVNAVLFKENGTLGVLAVHSQKPRDWFADEGLIRSVAERLKSGIKRAGAEEQLRKLEQRTRLAVEAAQMATWEWDLTTDMVYWNEQHFKLLAKAALPNPLPSSAFTSHLHPDDAESVRAQLNDTIRYGKSYEAEFRVVRQDGQTRWMSGYGRVSAEEQGKPLRVSGVMIDITDRKLAEQALRENEARLSALFESLPVGVGVIDLSGKLISGNQAIFNYLPSGIIPSQQADHHIHWAAYSPDGQILKPENYPGARALRGDRSVPGIEMRYTEADGRQTWTRAAAVPIWGEAGQVAGAVIVITDIDELKKTEKALKETDRRKDEFLAMLAHELRNPVSTVQNGLSVLKLTYEKESEVSEIIGMMEQQAAHLVRMIDDLLDVSRVTQGKVQLKKERLELGLWLKNTIKAVQPQFDDRKKKLHVTSVADNLFVQGDVTRLSQVITNLLTNSLRYTGEDGQVWISVTAENGQAVLRIRDNGVGLTPEQQASVFDLFVQVDNSLARTQGGLGIGLTLVRQLVEMHGGRVKVNSPGLGLGSEFSVYLPLIDSSAQQSSLEEPDIPIRSSSLRILVIDDLVDLGKLTAMLLRMKGYQVDIATSGRDGVEAVEKLKPAVVLCDIGMPDLDGYETAQLIRQGDWGHSVILLALSGYGQEEDKQRARAAGFDGHLTKPINMEEMQSVVATLRDSGRLT